MGKNYQVTLQNPKSKMVGSTTVFAWDEAAAKQEAKSRLEALGFTEVLRCQAM